MLILRGLVFLSILGNGFAFSQDQFDTRSQFPFSRNGESPPHPTTPHQPDSVLALLGRWPWGPCYSVDANDQYVVFGNGPSVHVMDSGNLSSPSIVGEYLADGLVFDVEINDSLVYVCTETKLIILRLEENASLSMLGEVGLGFPIRVVVSDSLACVTTLFGLLQVVDTSNPSVPLLRGSAIVGERPWSLAANGRFAYAGSFDTPGITIVDFTNPDDLSTSWFDVGGWSRGSFAADTLLFLGVGNQFRIYSTSQGDSLQLMGTAMLPSNADIYAVTVKDSMAYAVGQDTAFFGIDISNLVDPLVINSFPKNNLPSFLPTGIAVAKNTILVADYSGLLGLSSETEDSLVEAFFFPTGGDMEKVVLRDDLAFVASGYSGLWILDVSDPTNGD